MSFLQGIKHFVGGQNAQPSHEANDSGRQGVKERARDAAGAVKDYFKADGEYNRLWLDADEKHSQLYNDQQKYGKLQRKVDKLQRKLDKASHKLDQQAEKVRGDRDAVLEVDVAKAVAEARDSQKGKQAMESIGYIFASPPPGQSPEV